MECFLGAKVLGGSFPGLQVEGLDSVEAAGTDWKQVHLHNTAKEELTVGSECSFQIWELMLSAITSIMEQEEEKARETEKEQSEKVGKELGQ